MKQITSILVAKNIRAALRAKGWSNERFALEMGLKPQSVSRWMREDGKGVVPQAHNAAEIRRLLGIDIFQTPNADQEGPRDPLGESHLEAVISANETFCSLVGLLHRLHAVFLQHPAAVSDWKSMLKERKAPYEKMVADLDQFLTARRVRDEAATAVALEAIFRHSRIS
jgi:transcriptional regulator with XRE-family HTH domain